MPASLIANIITGLIGAFIVWLLKYLYDSINANRLNRSYSLSGKYISTYEDIDSEGNSVICKASATFKQKGLQVRGTTTNIEEGRTWNLNLDIMHRKYLVGTYSSHNPLDPGLGMVFLEIKPNNILEGLWAGYDSVNRSTQKGRYTFKKQLTTTIKSLGNYTAPALAIFGTSLGEKYIDAPLIVEYINCDKKAGFVAIYNSTVIGVVICEILDSLDVLINAKEVETLLPKTNYFTHGIIRSVAVLPLFRSQGVATELTERAIQWLKEAGATQIIALAWIEEKCNAGGLLEFFGFHATGVIENYWHQDSINKGYSCPRCGNPCCCSAAVYSLC